VLEMPGAEGSGPLNSLDGREWPSESRLARRKETSGIGQLVRPKPEHLADSQRSLLRRSPWGCGFMFHRGAQEGRTRGKRETRPPGA